MLLLQGLRVLAVGGALELCEVVQKPACAVVHLVGVLLVQLEVHPGHAKRHFLSLSHSTETLYACICLIKYYGPNNYKLNLILLNLIIILLYADNVFFSLKILILNNIFVLKVFLIASIKFTVSNPKSEFISNLSLIDNNLFVGRMDQYRVQGNNRLNQSAGTANTTVATKQSFWAKLYKKIVRALSFLNIRGRQLLWIGSTGSD